MINHPPNKKPVLNMSIEIVPIPAFDDNYLWLLHNGSQAVVVDPGDAGPVRRYLSEHQLELTGILITHHHWDHVNGLESLQNDWDCVAYGPADQRIPGDLITVQEQDVVKLPSLGIELSVMDTPGHTLSHISFYNDQWLFCGDTLFSIGCGRMFEGTPDVFSQSLNKISSLPPELLVYCTHEYTAANIQFALSIEPQNQGLQHQQKVVAQQRAEQQPSLPVRLGDELKLNPFLRTHEPELQQTLIHINPKLDPDPVACFAFLRSLKDHF